jgi:hypothetical protein
MRDVSNECPIYARAREWTPLDARLVCWTLVSSACTAAELVSPTSFDHRSQTRWHSVDLALAFRSGVGALAMNESHGVGDRLRGVLWARHEINDLGYLSILNKSPVSAVCPQS